MGVARDTAAKAFRDLQAKGFIVVKKGASLGVEGHGKCPEYEITFITTLHKEASKLYLYRACYRGCITETSALKC